MPSTNATALSDSSGAAASETYSEQTVPAADAFAGRVLSHYRLEERLGAGGMGVVYRATDLKLGRAVAIKLLARHLVSDETAKARFVREARAASALDHPNIGTVHDIGEEDCELFIVMAVYEGETLKQRLESGRLTVDEALPILRQIAAGLSAAHAAGIVHRDVKPANVLLTRAGQAKLLDFGLAKLTSGEAQTLTADGETLGTILYASPEQLRGQPLDERTDLWSLGVIAYEMLSGVSPFRAESMGTATMRILESEPAPLLSIPGVPPDIAALVSSLLQKEIGRRIKCADELIAALDARGSAVDLSTISVATSVEDGRERTQRTAWQPRRVVVPALLILGLLGVGGWLWRRTANVRWAHDQALPEIARLADQEEFPAAFALTRDAQRYIPGDPTLARLWTRISRHVSIETKPAGADVFYREYSKTAEPWRYLGQSPLTAVSMPIGAYAWKAEKVGSAPVEDVAIVSPRAVAPLALTFTLDNPGAIPTGMVRVPSGGQPFQLQIPVQDGPKVTVPDFWIDRYEVTNRAFKQFVDAGGYRNRDYWKHEFLKDNRRLSWEEGLALFRDRTGRAGPSTWEVGNYPAGQDDYPVTGVSWYEAAAYATFVGKSLPTIYHWSKAAQLNLSQYIVPLSNFGGRGPAPVGSHRGMSRFGTYDMAGNVKEWCLNTAGSDRRYILGGAWDEPDYMFFSADARSPFDRAPNFGFRCVRDADQPLPTEMSGDVALPGRDLTQGKPISDELFEAYRSLYTYDKTDLRPALEAVDDRLEPWRREKVTFAAAYGDERVSAYLFLPKTGRPPYQAVVVFPGATALNLRSSEQGLALDLPFLEFIMKTGRALMYPIYKSTYERGDGFTSFIPRTERDYRDHVIMWGKDLQRSVDYLETRPDIDRERIAYLGLSWGAGMGPILMAVEPRFRAGILALGGLFRRKCLPEVEQVNFAPRVRVPILMLNGKYDFGLPTETSQEPLFRLLGTSPEHKRHVLYDTGHAIPRSEYYKETLDWLDRYLGPVK